jgi:hypothetical protein
MSHQDISSNEGLVHTSIVRVPLLSWQLHATPEAQRRANAVKRPRYELPARDARRPNARWVYDGRMVAEHEATTRPSTQLNEHDLLRPGRLIFCLSAPTQGCTPMPTQSGMDADPAVRMCSFEFLQRHLLARCAHVVLVVHARQLGEAPNAHLLKRKSVCLEDTELPTATFPHDLTSDPSLCCAQPRYAALRASGICDYIWFGFFSAETYTPPATRHRIFHSVVSGVGVVQFPCASDIGHHMHLVLVADCYTKDRWQEDDALGIWLRRTATDCRYTPEEHAEYERLRNEALATPPRGDALLVAPSDELRLCNFRLRAETFRPDAFGRRPGSVAHKRPQPRDQALPPETRAARDAREAREARQELGLRAGDRVAEVIVGSWCVGQTMETAAHIATTNTKRAMYSQPWGSANRTDLAATTEYGFCKALLGLGDFVNR